MEATIETLSVEEYAELDALEAEFEDLRSSFGELGFTEAGSAEMDALDAELAGSELAEIGAQSAGGGWSVLDIADGDLDEQSIDPQFWNPIKKIVKGIGGFIKKKAARVIRTIVRYVKKYKKLAGCVPAVTKAVALFKSRKYGSALAAAYSAFRCIKKKL